MEVHARRAAGHRDVFHLLVAGGLALAMFAFGFGVYFAAGYLKVGRGYVMRPDETSAPALPGTMYVVQGGVIYRFERGSFAAVTHDKGWMQPAASRDGKKLVAVKRSTNFSDLYQVPEDGKSPIRLTDDSSKVVEGNHWIFYPRFSADGAQIFYDFDPEDPYNSYRVDLTILSSPVDSFNRWTQWTNPNQYTGGDVAPVPLRHGGLVYTKFSIDPQSVLHSQIWLQAAAGSPGVALTDPSLDCLQPAVSPDEKLIAMVCRKGQTQTAELDVAAFDESAPTLATPTALVSGRLVASPVFAPDGRSIAYLAPAQSQSQFQLWTVQPSGAPSPRQITTNLGLDAQSTPVWLGR